MRLTIIKLPVTLKFVILELVTLRFVTLELVISTKQIQDLIS
jgi:hypothetical protein